MWVVQRSFDVTAGYNFTNQFSLELAYQFTEYDTARDDVTYNWANGTSTTFVNAEGADLKTEIISIVFAYSF